MNWTQIERATAAAINTSSIERAGRAHHTECQCIALGSEGVEMRKMTLSQGAALASEQRKGIGTDVLADEAYSGRHSRVIAQLLSLCEEQTVEAAAKGGVKRVTAHYEGGGDSGQLEYVEYEGADTACVAFAHRGGQTACLHFKWGETANDGKRDRFALSVTDKSIDEAFQIAAEDRVENTAGPNWADGPGGSCEIVWEIETAKRWTVSAQITEYTRTEHPVTMLETHGQGRSEAPAPPPGP